MLVETGKKMPNKKKVFYMAFRHLKGFQNASNICSEICLLGTRLQMLNPISANPTKWSNTLKQLVGNSRQIV